MPRTSVVTKVIDGKAIEELLKTSKIQSATILGQPGGWTVLVRHGAGEHAVAAQRARTPRLWPASRPSARSIPRHP